jgi:flagellar biosynthesis/type III secretory pathway protein FliH
MLRKRQGVSHSRRTSPIRKGRAVQTAGRKKPQRTAFKGKLNRRLYNSGYNQAYDQAYDKGYSEGYAKGVEEGHHINYSQG